MPTYSYECSKCGEELEIYQGISESPKKKCPSCKKNALKRVLSGGAGVMFKGSGFYETDYKRKEKKSAATSDASSEKKPDAKTSSSESKPAETTKEKTIAKQ